VPGATRRLHLDSVGSTNAEAFRLAGQGEQGPLWVTAGEQTAGRGRRGRAWVSEPGNLYATLLLTDPAPPAAAASLGFVVALGLREALLALHPALADRLKLKWPNDVMLDGRKLSGILIEGQGSAPLHLAIGIGVNVAHHPADTPYPVTSLAASGLATAPDALWAALDAALMARLAQWNHGAGLPAILDDWRRLALGLGGPITVRLAERTLEGRFMGLDSTGCLVLETEGGRRETIAAGDVFPLNAAERS
jgi:BirA family biotin operon repressor/biotin-[acetyl-CoA-carboxylase] ligase